MSQDETIKFKIIKIRGKEYMMLPGVRIPKAYFHPDNYWVSKLTVMAYRAGVKVFHKPDLVVAFHNNLTESKGTKDMIRQAKAAGVPTEVCSSNKTGEENE